MPTYQNSAGRGYERHRRAWRFQELAIQVRV